MATTTQQFNLRWNNHTNNILQVFMEQLTNESLVDVTLSCQGQFLKAHKMVLSACSPYFQELFRLHQVPHPIIIINGMKFLDIKLVVEFMYKGEVKVQESDLSGLLLAAETLQVKGLSNVRNKYEKGQIQGIDSYEERVQPKTSPALPKDENSNSKNGSSQSKNEKDESIKENSTSQNQNQTPNSNTSSAAAEKPTQTSILKNARNLSNVNEYDDDLPAMIKVEPPDIRDIDEEDPTSGWESPRLVIDMQDAKLPDHPKNKNKMSTFSSIQLASASIEMSDDEPSPKAGSSDSHSELNSSHVQDNNWPKSKSCYRIPRPPNAFMIFANEWRRKLAYQHPMESNKEISVRLGMMWKNLNSDTKEGYYTASRKADEDHKRKYPGYYYSPKEARIRKTLKQKSRAVQLVKVFLNEESTGKTTADDFAEPLEKRKKVRPILPKPSSDRTEPIIENSNADDELEDEDIVGDEEEEEGIKQESSDEKTRSE